MAYTENNESGHSMSGGGQNIWGWMGTLLGAAGTATGITELNEARDARNLDVNEKFQLYKSQIDADFLLYKGQRDNFDALKAQIDELKTQVAINSAIRPYQDALIQCDINNARKDAEFDLYRRTCRMIQGELVLPNTPTVTGYPSYTPCQCPASSASTATMSK